MLNDADLVDVTAYLPRSLKRELTLYLTRRDQKFSPWFRERVEELLAAAGSEARAEQAKESREP